MKNLALLPILFSFFMGIAHAGVLTEKFCKRHQKKFDRKVNHRVSKEEISEARGNILKLVAHDECLEGVKMSLEISDFKALFKPTKSELCVDFQANLVMEDEEDIYLIEEVDEICMNYVNEKLSILEFKLEVSNRFGIIL